jgi:hypothetical protein
VVFTSENAAQLGRKGGKRGGKARAKSMTKAERKAQAVKAARIRWGMSAKPLYQGLTCLNACLKFSDSDRHITIILPRDTWLALYYEVSKERVMHSERVGMGGILVDYAPPEGESCQTGFWCQGAWVKHDPR